MNIGQYTLKMYAHCGMSYEIAVGDEDECKRASTRFVADKKKRGATVTWADPKPGELQRAEITEPETATMVPDWAGILALLVPPTAECKECGQDFVIEEKGQRFCCDCAEAYSQ